MVFWLICGAAVVYGLWEMYLGMAPLFYTPPYTPVEDDPDPGDVNDYPR